MFATGDCLRRELQKHGDFYAWYFFRNPTLGKKKAFAGSVAVTLSSVLSKWYTSVPVDLLHKEKEPIVWRNLHVGAERGFDGEHMQALQTKNCRDTGNGRRTLGQTWNRDATSTRRLSRRAWT